MHANLFATYPAYVFHSFHAKYKYSLCKLQPAPNFVYMLCTHSFIPSNNLENHSKIYFSLRSNKKNDIFFSTEVNIQSPFFHSQESQKLFSGCNEFLQVKIDFPFKDFLQGDLKTCINTLTRAEH